MKKIPSKKRTVKPSLKRETIKGILTEGAFDMEKWGSPALVTKRSAHNLDDIHESCGTACCIAGHIVAAASRLKLPKPKELRGQDLKTLHNVTAARAYWAEAYGQKSADRLLFYSSQINEVKMGRYSFDRVTPEDAVEHLRSV